MKNKPRLDKVRSARNKIRLGLTGALPPVQHPGYDRVLAALEREEATGDRWEFENRVPRFEQE